MDLLFAILPFFNAGLVGSITARITGINMSMCVLMVILYMGATPVEAIVVMLTFNTYTYFTIYSQEHRISFKNFTFFPGIRIVIPILLTIAGIAIQPFMGITFFVAIFLLEIFAMIYKQMEPKIRPSIRELLIMCGIASILVVIGLTLVQFIPKEWYFAFDGIVIIGVAYFMWAVGDRNAMQSIWDKLLYGAAFITGITGIDASDWLGAMHRNNRSVLCRCYPIVINTAQVAALLVSFVLYRYFSLGSLFTTIGAAIGVRLFGVYVPSDKGKFSYLALGLTVLAVLIFMLTQPVPSGFPELPLFSQDTF
ncbi:hypothetical protein NXG27_06895 [Megasphaera paucivorans]|uniref:Uncharacterized protein n=1 Tax=Megasphaera paucivorans TaxID=349095 RepID=A0A1H0C004_9FIRM|nr:hypothetical protein [Megasphaera paucivorans]SDN51288.1 hypothetical protein SAMN05660299_02827 [Megasphaera paucivorans]